MFAQPAWAALFQKMPERLVHAGAEFRRDLVRAVTRRALERAAA